MRGRVEMRRDRAQHGVAHVLQGFVVGEVARPDQRDAGLVEPALDKLLGENRGLCGGMNTNRACGDASLDALQEGRKVGAAQRHADRFRSTWPPAALVIVKVSSASRPGANSVTSVTALLKPFLISPIRHDGR